MSQKLLRPATVSLCLLASDPYRPVHHFEHVGRIMKFLSVAWMLICSATISASQASALTYQDIVSRLYDLSQLAEPPAT